MYVFDSRYLRNDGVKKRNTRRIRDTPIDLQGAGRSLEIPVAKVVEVLEIRRRHRWQMFDSHISVPITHAPSKEVDEDNIGSGSHWCVLTIFSISTP
jgi:hypothetical protein